MLTQSHADLALRGTAQGARNEGLREILTHSLRPLLLRAILLEQTASYLQCLWSALLSDSPHHKGGQHSQVARVGLLCLLGRRCQAGY